MKGGPSGQDLLRRIEGLEERLDGVEEKLIICFHEIAHTKGAEGPRTSLSTESHLRCAGSCQKMDTAHTAGNPGKHVVAVATRSLSHSAFCQANAKP